MSSLHRYFIGIIYIHSYLHDLFTLHGCLSNFMFEMRQSLLYDSTGLAFY